MPGSQKAKKATSSICPHNVVRIPIISVYVHLRIYVLFHIVSAPGLALLASRADSSTSTRMPTSPGEVVRLGLICCAFILDSADRSQLHSFLRPGSRRISRWKTLLRPDASGGSHGSAVRRTAIESRPFTLARMAMRFTSGRSMRCRVHAFCKLHSSRDHGLKQSEDPPCSASSITALTLGSTMERI